MPLLLCRPGTQAETLPKWLQQLRNKPRVHIAHGSCPTAAGCAGMLQRISELKLQQRWRAGMPYLPCWRLTSLTAMRSSSLLRMGLLALQRWPRSGTIWRGMSLQRSGHHRRLCHVCVWQHSTSLLCAGQE